MSTSLLNCEVLLSKQLGDYFSGTATSDGNAGGTTIVDTSLMSYPNDWIDSTSAIMWDMVTSGTYDEEERKISSLDNSTGTLTVLAHGGKIVSAVTFRVHRLFKASDKRIAIVDAAKSIYPHCYKEVLDESIVSGNWLKDGSFERWTTSTNLTDWNESTSTATKTTTSPYYKHGKTSCKIDTAAGYIEQSLDQWDDLKHLAGQAVTFTVQGWCDTASCLRIGVYDGTTTTYSSYHDGDSAWTEHNDPLEVTATIQDNPTDVSFRIYHDVAAGVSYVDDARVMGPSHPRIYIGNLGLSQNLPHTVSKERSNYSQAEPWTKIEGIDYDFSNGYMYLPYGVSRNYRLRIEGMGYLDFYDSSDVVGTDWDDTISLDSPQTEILVAQAAIYLWRTKALPSYDTGENQQALQALAFWENELRVRKARFSMPKLESTFNHASSR